MLAASAASSKMSTSSPVSSWTHQSLMPPTRVPMTGVMCEYASMPTRQNVSNQTEGTITASADA